MSGYPEQGHWKGLRMMNQLTYFLIMHVTYTVDERSRAASVVNHDELRIYSLDDSSSLGVFPGCCV